MYFEGNEVTFKRFSDVFQIQTLDFRENNSTLSKHMQYNFALFLFQNNKFPNNVQFWFTCLARSETILDAA